MASKNKEFRFPVRVRPPARVGEQNRVSRSMRIDVRTSRRLIEWGVPLGISIGVLVDRLADHAARTNFNPAKDAF